MASSQYLLDANSIDPSQFLNWKTGSTALTQPQVNDLGKQMGLAGTASPFELGFNLPTLKIGADILGTGANLFSAWNANKVANKQLALAEQFGNANLNNQISSYNTALEDRIRSRYGVEGKTQADADAYLAAHKMTR